jgi:hypothetical protein
MYAGDPYSPFWETDSYRPPQKTKQPTITTRKNLLAEKSKLVLQRFPSRSAGNTLSRATGKVREILSIKATKSLV